MRGLALLLVASTAVAASACGATQVPTGDAGTSDAGWDAGAPDGGDDAGVPDGGPLTATVFPRVGAPTDSVFNPAGPGLVLMGGGADVDQAFVWMRSTLAGTLGQPAGDVVVLRATGTNAYDAYIAGLAPFNSVQTVLLPPPSTLTDLRTAAALVDKAEAVFFAGGDQSHYAAWAGTELLLAVQRVYARGGVVGGTSAGLAVLGQFVFDARVASVTSAEALANPFAAGVTFTRGALRFGPLDLALTDTHFGARDRFGRLTAFMARQHADGAVPGGAQVLGLGVDQAAAVVVNAAGQGRLVRDSGSTGVAYFVLGGPATQVVAGQPLVYPNLTVMRLDAAGQLWDFGRRCGTGPTYALSVDARQANPFSVDPYPAAGPAGTCP